MERKKEMQINEKPPKSGQISSWVERRKRRNLGGHCKGDLTMLAMLYF